QPIVTALAAQLSIVGLAANVAAGPFVGPVTVLGLVAALVSLVSPTLAEVFGWLAGWCVQPIVLVAQIGSTAPAATWAWPARPASLAVLTIGCLLIAEVILPRVLPRRGLAIGLAVLLVIGAFREPPQPGWPGDWTVVACDVGQGGAQLIRTGAQSAILVDTGPDPDALAHCLTSVGVTEIPLLVITHLHADHTAGLPGVAGRFPVTMVLVGPSISGFPNSPLAMVGLPTPTSTAAGDVVQLGSVRWTTLAAGPVTGMLASTGPEDAIANDSGVVGLIETPALRVLVTGDIEIAGQQALVASGADLRADVLVVPHHGSAKQEPTFLKAVAAPIALVQVGEHND
ncbi:MAG: ComEC/Rec2 family competence protein, partial [Brooklawnia sp.]